MNETIAIYLAQRGVYVRFSHQPVVRKQTFVGGTVVTDFAENDTVVGVTITQLGAIELQVLSDLARTYDLNFSELLYDTPLQYEG